MPPWPIGRHAAIVGRPINTEEVGLGSDRHGGCGQHDQHRGAARRVFETHVMSPKKRYDAPTAGSIDADSPVHIDGTRKMRGYWSGSSDAGPVSPRFGLGRTVGLPGVPAVGGWRKTSAVSNADSQKDNT